MKKEYHAWVDIVKGIAIIAVVLMHVGYAFPDFKWMPTRSLLGNSWHMPVFMLVAGFFISTDKISHPLIFVKHKFLHLYCRLLYFYIPILLLHNVFIQEGFYSLSVDYGGRTGYLHVYNMTDFLKRLFEACFFMGREPYASPLWFVYVLFLAFIVMSIHAYVIHLIRKRIIFNTDLMLGIIFLLYATISLFLTNVFSFTIPRCSNVFTSTWLIYLGYLLYNRFHVTFTNSYVAIVSVIVVVGVCLNNQEMALITNSYTDIAELTAVGCGALYASSYIAKKIEGSWGGRLLTYIGHKSFWIMALHLLSINIVAWAMNQILNTDIPCYVLGASADNIVTLALFWLAGIFMPVLFASLFDTIKIKAFNGKK